MDNNVILNNINENLNETIQVGDTVMYDKMKGYVIGQIGKDLIVQVQGSSYMAKPEELKDLTQKPEDTLKPQFKFSKETQQLMFEQYVRCGIFVENTAIKTNNCFVKYSDWSKANINEHVNVLVEGHQNFLYKSNVKVFEDVNDFANLEKYIEGVIIDENTGEAIENVMINIEDYTQNYGDADPVRIIRNGDTETPSTETMPKALIRTLTI